MQIHRVRGKSFKDALVRARESHGEDALVISQEEVPGGVALAVARRAEKVVTAKEETPARGPLAELESRLREHGASPDFVERITSAVAERRESGRHVLDLAADVTGELFPPGRLARIASRTRVLAFVGASGAGKTTALVEFARRSKAAGRAVEIAALAGQRTGALPELREWSRALELPLTVLHPGVRVQPGAFGASRVDLVLLDTGGELARVRTELARASRMLGSAGAVVDVCVVLAASASTAALARVRAELEGIAPASAVVTKLDETRAPLPALEASLALGAPLSFLCSGPEGERSFVRADADAIADLCLRGRIA
jgi:flagellar biosynthesis GTPase FlhF